MMFRKFAATVAMIAGLLVGAAASAGTLYNVDGGVAVKGADVVAYFTDDKRVAGKAEFAHQWKGATWRFASAAHRDAFKADPMKYAPAYGGYCAWAVSQGYTAPIDPDAWRIVNGKLYLNYSRSIQSRWALDINGNIAKADHNWPGVSAKLMK